MDLSLREIFERARAAQEWVPPTEADLLFAAALRKAVEMGSPLLPARVMLREGGVLELLLSDGGPEPEQYRAPEVVQGDPRRVDARAQVYTAGAVGYELFTGLPPPRPPHGPGPELTGPLGDVVRVAMSHDRRERFSDLQQLLDAVATIEPHRSPPEERGLLAALLARVKRWEERAQNAAALAVLRQEYETLEARVSFQEAAAARSALEEPQGERLAVLESALQAVRAEGTAGLARLQQNLRELVEDRRRDEALEREKEEMREAHAALHPPRAPLGPVLGAAAIAAIVASIATVSVLERLRVQGPASISSSAVAAPAPAAALAPSNPAAANLAAANQIAASAAAESAADAGAAAATPSSERAAAPAAGAAQKAGMPIIPPAAPLVPAAEAPAASASAGAPANAAAPASAGAHPLAVIVPSAAPAAELSPRKRARQLLGRGDSALERGRSDAAATSFRSALELDAGLAEAHRGLGMAYALQGDDAQAKKEYELYLGAEPKAADAADIRAAINELNSRSKLGDAP